MNLRRELAPAVVLLFPQIYDIIKQKEGLANG